MANSFTFNDKNSVEDFEMYFETLPLLPLMSIAEANNPQISCTLGFKTNQERLIEIRKWLSSNMGELTFSYDTRTFIVTNIIAQESIKNDVYTVVNIIFEVLKECTLKTDWLTFTSGFNSIEIDNPGTFDSYPAIAITGSGTLKLYINDVLISTIKDADGEVTLDSRIQECYTGNSLNIQSVKNRDLYGDFIVFTPGLNRLKVESDGSLERIVIEPRWVI